MASQRLQLMYNVVLFLIDLNHYMKGAFYLRYKFYLKFFILISFLPIIIPLYNKNITYYILLFIL